MPQAKFVRLDARGILAVAGPDRSSFLQGLVSNDVMRVAPDRAVYAALLTPQGKYLHDFIMVEHDEAIWLDAEEARLADLKRRLSIYRLRAKVELAERPDLAVAAVFGDGAPVALGLPQTAGTARAEGQGVVLVDPRLAALGARVIVDRRHLAGLEPEFAAEPISPPMTCTALASASLTAAATSCPTNRSCSKPGSTNSTASIGRRAAISARS